MKIIGSALGNERHLRTGRAALVGIVVRCCYAKLLYGVQRHRQNGLEGVTAGVIYRHSIQGDVALVAARAVDGPISRVNVGVDIGTVAGIEHASLETEQVGHVAPFHWKLFYLVLVECVAKRSIRRIQCDCLRRDFNRFTSGAHL